MITHAMIVVGTATKTVNASNLANWMEVMKEPISDETRRWAKPWEQSTADHPKTGHIYYCDCWMCHPELWPKRELDGERQ